MMTIKQNRHVNLLLLLLTLTAAGCTQNSKDALSVNDLDSDVAQQDKKYVDGYFHNYQPTDKNEISKTVAQNQDTVWARLLSLYSLPKIENERIDHEINWYLSHPNALNSIQQRAEPYLHLILDEIEAKNIPGELALLPVVESAFIPNAYSKAEASGLWQFVPSTGRMFGLQQNSWYDGRRDVYASTKAATTYLKQLSETFDGDWLLALASYNYGKGNVRKSIERNEYRNLPTDYWSLSLPDETTNYVPRLLAIAKIFANANEYNVNLHHIPNKPYFEIVPLDAQLDLSKAAEMADMSLHDFLKLNPAFNKKKTAPEGSGPRRLLIPVAKAEGFKENLAQLPFEEWVSSSYDADDNKNEVDVRQDPIRQHDVKDAKPILALHKAKLAEKDKGHHNKKDEKVASVASTLTDKSNEKSKTEVKTVAYVVKKGDTVTSLSQKFAVDAKSLADWNKLSAKNTLIEGHKLTVRAPSVAFAAASTKSQSVHNKKVKSSS
ncbi:MAG: transglycosylase SLT domain-containing protein [Methylococcales bacterium]|nr:transglycosylase SLT domain-containing protein [Methylococcales bacterium]